MGAYLEWAKQNLTETAEYAHLKDSVERIEREIEKAERALRDINNGVMPDQTITSFLGTSMNFAFSDMLIRPSAVKRMLHGNNIPLSQNEIEEDEDFIADAKRKRFNDELENKKTEVNRKLNGWVADFSEFGDDKVYTFKGLYEELKEARQKLDAYEPHDLKRPWKRHVIQSEAINQRLHAFGWTGDCTSDTGSIITLVPSSMGEIFWDVDFKFSLRYEQCWIAMFGDNTVSFTRLTWGDDPVDALQRALLSYIDARWDYLISQV